MPTTTPAEDPGTAWRVVRVDGVTLVRCDALRAARGVTHAFSTRIGPDGDCFDLRGSEADTRRRRFLTAAGLAPVAAPRQIHGRRVIRACELLGAREPLEADGVVATRLREAALAPAVGTADCVPLLLADRDGEAVAAIHAGWRGAAAGIAGAAVRALQAVGVEPGRLLAALGPAIGTCCYEVGAEVAEAVARASACEVAEICRTDDPRLRLDLRAAVSLQLRAAGVRAPEIHLAPWCTGCSSELFFSFRREGAGAGRMLAAIGWSRGSAAFLDA